MNIDPEDVPVLEFVRLRINIIPALSREDCRRATQVSLLVHYFFQLQEWETSKAYRGQGRYSSPEVIVPLLVT
jgi:hypothetical protein